MTDIPRARPPAPGPRLRPKLLFAVTALFAMVFLPLPGGYDVFDTSIYLLVAGDVQNEDAYVATDLGRIDGVVDGDLVIAAGDLSITGRVTGDVFVASKGSVIISGTVDGAVRGVAREVVVEESGVVGDDLAVAAVRTRVRGSVGRDAIVFGGRLDLSGRVGRDIHGRFVRGNIDGDVARNVDVSTSSLVIGPDTVVGGSFLYRSNRAADRDPASVVTGQFARLSPRPSFFVDVSWRLATMLGFLAFLFTGLVVLWLFGRTSERAARAVATRPWRTLLLGVAALVAVPLAILTFVVSLVGIPLGIVLLLGYLLSFFFGPLPAVAAVGARIPGGRGSLFAAFVVGTIAWRLAIAVLSIVAGALYVLALAWGVGGWVSAVWEGRGRSYPSPSETETTAST